MGSKGPSLWRVQGSALVFTVEKLFQGFISFPMGPRRAAARNES
jgi:hypothetical protein